MTIDSIQPTDIELSDKFSVFQTQHGRACFAAKDIPKGTEILHTSPQPFGSTVLYEFRKEVCSYCFKYNYGDYCKFRLPKPQSWKKKKYQGSGLWFCSEVCVSQWQHFDENEELTNAFEELLDQFQIKSKHIPADVENYDEYKHLNVTQEYLESFWESVNEWESTIQKMKPSKRLNQIPYINEDDYNTVRFVTMVLFNISQNHQSMQHFNRLQSNELLKIAKYPVLIRSLGNIYKFLKTTLPVQLQSLLTTETLRLIVGREFGNSFGIWQLVDDSSNENKEFLGYMLHPEASFFNHSCRPNIKKYRIDNRMYFQTTQDIKQGEQVCIDYYHVLDEPFEVRQKTMMENWFFNCSCERCVLEATELNDQFSKM